MTENVALVTDSSACLPVDARRFRIREVPIQVRIGPDEYRDGIDLDALTLYRALEDGVPVKSAAPTPVDYLDAIEESNAGAVVVVTPATEFTWMYRNALLAAELAPTRVAVVDSRSATAGHGLVVLAAAEAIGSLDAIIIGPGSFYTSLMPTCLVAGVREAVAQVRGPVIYIANLLTEGRGMVGFTAADAVARIEEASGRKVDVVITNMKWPSPQVLARYAMEHKEPLAPGQLPDHCELVGGEFWTGEIARHNRQRLAYAVWSVLSRRLLGES